MCKASLEGGTVCVVIFWGILTKDKSERRWIEMGREFPQCSDTRRKSVV